MGIVVTYKHFYSRVIYYSIDILLENIMNLKHKFVIKLKIIF